MDQDRTVTYCAKFSQNQPGTITTTENVDAGVEVSDDDRRKSGFYETREIYGSRLRWIKAFVVSTTLCILCLVLVIYFATIKKDSIDSNTQRGACLSCPCLNGAKCKDVDDSFRCECLPGYNGHKCENDIDECDSSPCQNGGSCIDSINGYTCDCPVRYGGENCQTVICVSGWRQYKSKCYFFGTKNISSWHEAKAYCEANNSMLVEITSKDIDDFLKKELNTGEYKRYNYFTGGTDAAFFGVWKWAGSNKTFSFVDWGVNQPGYSEHCVALPRHDGFRFHDYPCQYNMRFICETDL